MSDWGMSCRISGGKKWAGILCQGTRYKSCTSGRELASLHHATALRQREGRSTRITWRVGGAGQLFVNRSILKLAMVFGVTKGFAAEGR